MNDPGPSMRTDDQLTDTQREGLILLIEEAGEVIQAATKLLRFGPLAQNGTKSYDNIRALSLEIGDFQAVLAACYSLQLADPPTVNEGRRRKPGRIEAYSRHIKDAAGNDISMQGIL